jgi:type 1 glutamine amidotransferase
MARCVLVSASADYTDPWHPFDELAGRITAVLEPVAGPVELRTDVDAALAEQDGSASLLVVSIGDAGPGTPSEAARRGLLRHLGAGAPLLVLHVSATAFPDWPEWEAVVGGRWVEGTTFHPEQGPFRVRIEHGSPVTEGVEDFETVDEAYTALRVRPDVTVLARHELDGEAHPLAWTHRFRDARVAYVALGHDAGAYDAEGTRRLVGRVAGWLLEQPGAASTPPDGPIGS